MIFDINDLDETLPAPWEWDVKRLVASFVLAARSNGLSDGDGREAAGACAQSYREHMRDFANMDVMDIWYARIDDQDILATLPKAPKRTFSAERFMARHMSSDSMKPDVPSSEPVMIWILFISTNPMAASAKPP